MLQLNNLIRSLDIEISPFEPFKLCDKHHIQTSYTCLNDKCSLYFKAFCTQCVSHKHKNINIRYLNTALSRGMVEQWERVQKQYEKMKQIQINTDINLGYCIDIFKQKKEEVHKEINYGVWQQMIKITIQVKKQVKTQGEFLRKMKQFSEKYHINWTEDGKASSAHEAKILVSEIQRNKRKIENINKFAQKALILSKNISQQIQSIIAQAKQNIIKNVKSVKITTLTQTPQQNSNADQLFLNLKNTSINQTSKLQAIISKFLNIKTLQIKTNKFTFQQSSWRCLIEYFPTMKFLRQLKLHLSGDLKQLPGIFESNKTILRPIDKLYIKISDQKVNIQQIYRICNSFELSGLWITLSRCYLNYTQAQQLIDKIKIRTTMTNLVLSDLHFILSINSLSSQQKLVVTQQFQQKTLNITKRSLQI